MKTTINLVFVMAAAAFGCATPSEQDGRDELVRGGKSDTAGMTACVARCETKGTGCGYPVDIVGTVCEQTCSAGPSDEELTCLEDLACELVPDGAAQCNITQPQPRTCQERCVAKGLGCGYPAGIVATVCEDNCDAGLDEEQLVCLENLACEQLPAAQSLCAPPPPTCTERCVAKGVGCGFPEGIVTTVCEDECTTGLGEGQLVCLENLTCPDVPSAPTLCAAVEASACTTRCDAAGAACSFRPEIVHARCESRCSDGITEAQLVCVEALTCDKLPAADDVCI